MAASKRTAPGDSAEDQLDSFLDKFTPAVAALARACLAKMRARLPGAVEIVYDNYPRWVTLFFLRGAGMPDPKGLLKGKGKVVRHIVLASAADLDQSAIQDLMAKALQRAEAGIDPKAAGQLVIRSVSAKQRARRPT